VQRSDALVTGAFLSRALTSVVACWGLFCLVELVDWVNVLGVEALGRYAYRMPQGLVLVSPLALLGAACWTGLFLLRSGQLTALAALGCGPRRALAGVVVAGTALGGGLWGGAQTVAPWGLARWQGAPSSGSTYWLRQGQYLVRYETTDSADRVRSVVVAALDERGLPRWTMEAEGALRDDQGWLLHGVTRYEGGREPVRWSTRRSPVRWAPLPVDGTPQHLGWLTLRRMVQVHGGGRQAQSWATELALRLALAFACPVCVMLGLVAGAGTGGGPARAWMSAVLAGVAYWAVLSPCWALTLAGALTPEFLAWAPSLVAGGGAVAMYWWLLRSPVLTN
jgi:lipopolysaccharide export LptBFGC system permease protein LptF